MNRKIPKYVSIYAMARFHWMLEHTPQRLKKIWEEGEFENYFEKLGKEGKEKMMFLREEVVSERKQAGQIAAMMLREIPERELTDKEKQDQADLKSKKTTPEEILGAAKQEMKEAKVFMLLHGAPILF